jgi:imidazolonepropionase-like amidohydrolase
MILRSRGPIIVVVILWLQAIGAAGQTPETLAIIGATVIDTIDGRAIPNSTVTIRDGAIVSITPDGVPPPGAQHIDARGKFLIAGLWDMHAHHQLTGEVSLPLYVATGVTGTRDMGSDLEFILRLRRQTTSRQVLGPRIVAAGPILDDRPADFPFRLTVRTGDDARNAVRMLKERGLDLVKVHDRTPPEAYAAIAEEARRLDLPFAGHVPRGVTFEQAAAAGQRSVEHLAGFRIYTQCSGGQGYAPGQCKDFFGWLAKSGMWQTPTLVSWRNMFTIGTPAGNPEQDHLAYASPSLREFLALNQKMSNVTSEGARGLVSASDTAAVAVSDMQKAGVGILAGCDGMVPGFCVHDELVLMVRGGMSPLAALQTATINPARYLGLEKTLGSVGPGKAADLVVLDGNPLDDIANVRRVHAVVIGGRVLNRQELDATLARARSSSRHVNRSTWGRNKPRRSRRSRRTRIRVGTRALRGLRVLRGLSSIRQTCCLT